MKEQLVSFETAKLAKEKEFNELTNAMYSTKDIGNWEPKLNIGFNGDCSVHLVLWNEQHTVDFLYKYYSAPTQSLLQKWLRDEHSFHVDIDYDANGTWFYVVSRYPSGDVVECDINNNMYNSFENCLEDGLIHALKHGIN